MAIDKLSNKDIPKNIVPAAPPHEDSSNEEPTDPQHPDLTCTPNLT
jgi:hypothetical protein